MPPRILILGGTAEARDLAATLIGEGYDVVSSLAGVTKTPLLPRGEVRRGGFGGEEGLLDYLRDGKIDAVVDATHPFAATISRHAHGAAARAGIPYCRLERPEWVPEPGDVWIDAATAADAAARLPTGASVLLTIGRQTIEPFVARPDLSGLVRMIEEPPHTLPERWTLVLARPPFSLDGEIRLIVDNRITHLVSKNAGGEDGRAKLKAARETKIPVVMIARPAKPETAALWPARAVVRALRNLLSP